MNARTKQTKELFSICKNAHREGRISDDDFSKAIILLYDNMTEPFTEERLLNLSKIIKIPFYSTKKNASVDALVFSLN